MKYNEVLCRLQNLINRVPLQSELIQILGLKQSTMSERAKRNSKFTPNEILLLNKHYGINLYSTITNVSQSENTLTLTYYPDVYLSAGYGVEVYDETPEKITLDARLLVTERGNMINPANCEIVKVSGNSMSPEYRHGDRVIIDRSDIELMDGQIYAFRYKKQCYVKEINLLGNRIKCISLNKEYDPFYIESDEDFIVLGRILPRIRL